ncbi:CAP domain-containing protein [Flavobacterium sp.]|uniref:CAP domain-containing protein n=1 Tax=Flavobacterium sp. TaxID=239 RepID=UPI002B4B1F3F|nr:CAP domain-containing protein [Flavobacterium sp.]HLP64602.1 CAP domain-containing protein [Flavobacterium sp.]
MKTNLLRLFVPFILVLTLVSCSKDSQDEAENLELITNYDYSTEEVDLANRINDYRESVGKNRLELINHISYKSLEHNEYMIENNVVNHDYFDSRANNIMQVLGAVRVGENIAYNFSTPNSALNAWLNSPGHKDNLDGDYTHFGISITINPTNGKRYYTNIFMKK